MTIRQKKKTQLSLEISTENFFENYNLLWYKKF